MITLFCILFSGTPASKWMTMVCDNGYNPGDDSYTPSVLVIYNDGLIRWARLLDESLLQTLMLFLHHNNVVGATKHLRTAVNIGLGEAKSVIDTLNKYDNCEYVTQTKTVVTSIRFG